MEDPDPIDPWCIPDAPKVINFEDITAAAFKIKSGIITTPCVRSHLSETVGIDIWVKQEFLQFTGSFKERGARFALLNLSEEHRQKGVIGCSLGNHAQALAYHGKLLGIPVTVVMPTAAPLMKIQRCRDFGANVVIQGSTLTEAKSIALRMGKENGTTYINGYDHPHVLAGAGSMGLEISEQVSGIDAILIPVGGGGMLAGVGLAIKSLFPTTAVIGLESDKCPAFQYALEQGKPTLQKVEPTLADGLAVPLVGYNAYAIAAPLVDKMISVQEEFIALGILRMIELEKCIVEGAGAIGFGAILSGQMDEFKGKRVVMIASGGNIDTTILNRCLVRGLAIDSRIVRFIVTVGDRPGGISDICRLLASIGVSIKDLSYERTFIKADVFHIDLRIVCETRDNTHVLEVLEMLSENFSDLILPPGKTLIKAEEL